jgi:hypothetical protein
MHRPHLARLLFLLAVASLLASTLAGWKWYR